MAGNLQGAVKVRLERLSLDTDQGILESEKQKWGLTLKEVYRLGLSFYKDKEGKALHLSYEDKLKLIAYTQQAIHGPLDEKTAPQLGVLDVIGRDRRAAWLELGSTTQTQAMVGFIHMLDRLCPLFKAYVEANKKDSDDKNYKRIKAERESKELLDEQHNKQMEQMRLQSQQSGEEEQVRRIKEALNEQTYEQFLQYSRQQLPGNPDQQAVLVRQLQDQHYLQYTQQMQTQAQAQQTQNNEQQSQNRDTHEKQTSTDDKMYIEEKESNNIIEKQDTEGPEDSSLEQADDSQSEDGDEYCVSSASMWTRAGAAAFKQAVRGAAGGGGVLQVGHGETLTVRVPTHEGGRCLFWEFATDNFDIGFGVYFEWNKSLTNQVTVHVAESDDEADVEGESYDYEDDEELVGGEDLECGAGIEGGQSALSMLKAPISIVIPIFRRDSHLEVYAGSHTYPGEGVYLLKFDNTFSLWRSKTLYYRVYYTR